jgi:cytochrome c peroxidase
MLSATLGALALLGASGCQGPEKKPEPAADAMVVGQKAEAAAVAAKPVIDPATLAVFKPPLPAVFDSADNPLTDEKVALGRQLYFDTRLSKNQDISCNTCHLLDKFGVDGKKVSTGHKGQNGTRNSPTVYNAAGHFVQFWDGRSPSVEHQATQPLGNPVEMAMKDDAAIEKLLRSIPGYVSAFKKVFPDDKQPVTVANLGKAIGAFERKLVTPAPWDKFLAGDDTALTDEQKSGFLAFTSNGCTACHMGTLLGAAMYQKVGAVKPWPNQTDQGRFEVTKVESDKMLFKAPSLRNVAETAPYFHDGSVQSLEEAIQAMGAHQLGRDISAADAKLMASWMKSLTGALPAELIKAPELPASGPTTPKPDPT